jgi:hypothetical protein
MAKTDVKSTDGYIATHPEDVQAVLQRVPLTIRKAVPDAEEVVSYQIPAYKLQGVAMDLHVRRLSNLQSLVDATWAGSDFIQCVRELFSACRSFAGRLRQSLAKVDELLPLTIHKVATGTQVLDWTLPKKGNTRDACIKDAADRRIADTQQCNLHVVNYSAPITVRVVKPAPFASSLVAGPPDRISYGTTGHTESGEFCISNRQLQSFSDTDNFVNAIREDDAFTYGEYVHPGQEEGDHPQSFSFRGRSLLLTLLILWSLVQPAKAPTLAGEVNISDGDTNKLGSNAVQLFEIDSLEGRPIGERDRRSYDCEKREIVGMDVCGRALGVYTKAYTHLQKTKARHVWTLASANYPDRCATNQVAAEVAFDNGIGPSVSQNGPSNSSPSSQSGLVELTHSTTAIHTSYDGQVVENLDLHVASGDAITVTNDNVTIRNCRIYHEGGDGIFLNGASNVTIENCEIINLFPPAANGPETSPLINNIFAYASPRLTVDHVTVRDGSSGMYLLESPGATISNVEGYNFRGPMPRGQFVQFDKSGNSSLTNFYVYHDPAHSHPADNVSVYYSPDVTISNGLIDGNNSTDGVGVMFEGNSGGGKVSHVDAVHMGNGAFSSYSPNVTFDYTRSFDNIATDQGRGLPLSNALIWNVSNTGISIQHSTYTHPGNPNNIWWVDSHYKAVAIDVRQDSNATPMQHPITNRFEWN